VGRGEMKVKKKKLGTGGSGCRLVDDEINVLALKGF